MKSKPIYCPECGACTSGRIYCPRCKTWVNPKVQLTEQEKWER